MANASLTIGRARTACRRLQSHLSDQMGYPLEALRTRLQETWALSTWRTAGAYDDGTSGRSPGSELTVWDAQQDDQLATTRLCLLVSRYVFCHVQDSHVPTTGIIVALTQTHPCLP